MSDIYSNTKVFLIAEVSANHNNDYDRTRLIIKQAKAAGADAVKFQTYTADTITLQTNRADFLIPHGKWKGKSLYDLYSQGSMPWDWHNDLFIYAKSLGLKVMSTPFDCSAVDFLEKLNVEAYKIASFEMVDVPLIRKVGRTNKHVFLSTGMTSFDEIREALDALGHSNFTLLHCISNYPSDPSSANLGFIQELRSAFGCNVGLSDHCVTNSVADAAVALGASAVEKHFTLNQEDGGLDDSFSQTPESFQKLRISVDEIKEALQTHVTRPDLASRRFRKSIYAIDDITMGENFSDINIKVIRPGFGLHPRHYSTILDKKSKRTYKRGDRISPDELLY